MDERDNWTIDAMEQYGGSFVKALGAAARRADPINLSKIKTTFAEYWQAYEITGMKMEQKRNI